jgi:S-adenosylmethionine uptake transporter
MLTVMGVLSAAASVFFINAYRFAEANFVAPFEYSAIVWATLNGMLFFGDFPDWWNGIGTLTVISAGLYMLWMDSRRHHPSG